MSLTDVIIVMMTLAMLLFAVYDEVITDKRHGRTLLKIFLLKRGRVDGLIFVGLIGILIYNNIHAQGTPLTTYLLLSLALIAFWTFWIRQPKCLFKTQGFIFAGVFIPYTRIQSMNLSEDGVLVIQLEKRNIYVRVKQIDDLEKIYSLLIKNQ
ncbi:hypothetical protein CIG19_03705 [Enterobacterales bacterium CwR94]|nr:hypothetical protein CIG19_03705 [Enterobacterales bacterium CwR94]